jgi:hypothetical protein
MKRREIEREDYGERGRVSQLRGGETSRKP